MHNVMSVDIKNFIDALSEYNIKEKICNPYLMVNHAIYIDVKRLLNDRKFINIIIFIREMVNLSDNDDFLVLIVMHNIDNSVSDFFKIYHKCTNTYKDICDETTKAHLEKIVAFLDEQDRLTQPTP